MDGLKECLLFWKNGHGATITITANRESPWWNKMRQAGTQEHGNIEDCCARIPCDGRWPSHAGRDSQCFSRPPLRGVEVPVHWGSDDVGEGVPKEWKGDLTMPDKILELLYRRHLDD